jgi:hypothetical protein
MRGYSVVAPQFWIGETGKALKKGGPEAVIVGLYLMTSPHANMLGLYYMPELYMAHETGLGLEGASKGLKWAIEVGFCSYDKASEVVWVHEMARFQVGDKLKAGDNRVKGVQNEYDSLPSNPYLAGFFEKYSPLFLMTDKRIPAKQKQAPSETLGSQEQEQEQEQDQEQHQEHDQEHLFPPSPVGEVAPKKNAVVKTVGAKPVMPTTETWGAYSAAYAKRYGTEPVRNAVVNGQLANVVKRLGADEAPKVAAWYVTHNAKWYVQQAHSVAALVKDAEKLRTEWVTRRQVTSTEAAQADRTQTNFNAFAPMLQEAQAREASGEVWNGE